MGERKRLPSSIGADIGANMYVASPNQAAWLMDMPVRELWPMVMSGKYRAVFLPNGDALVRIPFEDAVREAL